MFKFLQFFILSTFFLGLVDFNSYGEHSNYEMNSNISESDLSSVNDLHSTDFNLKNTFVAIDNIVPAACYNFINDFENDNGETGIEPLTPNEGTGTFIDEDELCSNSNNKHYQMTSGQGLDVDNGSLTSTDQYTVELLFKVDDIPLSNTDGRVFIMNFSNVNYAGLFINPDGTLCYYNNLSGGTEEACGTDLVSPNYPNDFPTEWINIAISYDDTEIVVFLNGNEQFRVAGDIEFNLQNQTSYFVPSASVDDNPIANITIDYIRYFDEVLDAASIESLNLAAVARNDIEIQASSTEGCIDDEITLTATGGDRSFYIWSTGDTTYADVLNYTIHKETDTIWVQGVAVSPCDRQCFDIADTIVISGFPNPEMDIVGPSEVCEGDPVLFSATEDPAGGLTEYFWSTIGSISSESGANTKDYSVIYDANGTMDINLQITNEYGCVGDTTFTVNVGKTPTPDFDLPTGACTNEDVVILYTGNADLNLSSPSLEFDWDWGVDGTAVKKSGGQEAYDVQWSSFGTKTVTLQVTENGCTSTILSQNIEVSEKPVISFDPVIPTSICIDETVPFIFDGTPGTNAVFDWDFGDAIQVNVTNESTDFELEWDSAGTKTVTLTITNDGCVTTESFEIDVLIPATTELSYPDFSCAGEAARFIYTGSGDTNDPGTSFSWIFEGSDNVVNLGDEVYDVTWNTPGTHTISVEIIGENGCANTSSFEITINPSPSVNFNLPDTICEFVERELTVNLPDSTYQYTWDLGADGVIVDSNTDSSRITAMWENAGNKTVSVSASQNGCTTTRNETISVLNSPNPSFNIPLFCLDEVSAEATSTITYTGDNDVNIDTFEWDFDINPAMGESATQIAGTQNYDIVYTTPGRKEVTLIVTNENCGSQSFTKNISVNNFTEFEIESINDELCEGAFTRVWFTGVAEDGANFNWDFDTEAGDVINEIVADSLFEITYNSNGPKVIRLDITGVACNDDSFESNFVIGEVPTSDFTLEAIENCIGDLTTVTYTGTTSDGRDLIWDWVDGIPTQLNDSTFEVNWPTPGIKELSLVVEDGGCISDTTFQTVTVYDNSISGIDFDNNICTGGVGTISINPEFFESTANWSWTLNGLDLLSSNADDSELTFTSDSLGAKTIRFELSGGVCNALDTTFTIDILGLEVLDSITNNSCTSANDGTIELMVNSSITNDSLNYTWSGPNDFSATTKDIEGLVAGEYMVTITSGITSCVFTETYIIEIANPPSITINTSNLSKCDINDGSISASIDGFNHPFNIYIIDTDTDTEVDGSRSNNISTGQYTYDSLEAGDYELLVEYDSCIQSEVFSIDFLISVSAEVVGKTNTEYGESNGNIDLSISNTENSVSIIVNGTLDSILAAGTTSYLISELSAGSYDIVIRDQYTTCEVSLVEELFERANTATDILSFELPNTTTAAIIDTVNHMVEIEVDGLSDLTNMIPQIQISDGASISPDSNITRDFTEPVLYTVTAADSITSQVWEVIVNTSTIIKEEQTITFDIPSLLCQDQSPYPLHATSSSGLPVSFAVDSGSATVHNDQLILTNESTIIVKAFQAGNDTLEYAEVIKRVSVYGAYDVTVNVQRQDETPLEEGLAKLFDIEGGLYKRMKFTDGNLVFRDVCNGEYILQIIPTGSATEDVFPTYFERTHFNKDASVLNIFNDFNMTMIMKEKSGASNHDGGYGQIKGKLIKSEDSSTARISIGKISAGEGLKEMIVYLIDFETSNLIRAAVTDSLGNFEMTEIANGNYNFLIDIPGLEQSTTSFELPYEAQNMEIDLTIHLNSEGIESVNLNTILNNKKSNLNIQLFPNPTNDFLYIAGNLRLIQKVSVFNLEGKIVKTVTFMNEDIQRIDLSDLSNGIYYISFDENKSDMIRIIKK